MKKCATIFGYTNAKRRSVRGFRSAGIIEIVNYDKSVSKKGKLFASRHKNIATNSLYPRTASKKRDSRYEVFGAKNSPESVDSNKVDSQKKLQLRHMMFCFLLLLQPPPANIQFYKILHILLIFLCRHCLIFHCLPPIFHTRIGITISCS